MFEQWFQRIAGAGPTERSGVGPAPAAEPPDAAAAVPAAAPDRPDEGGTAPAEREAPPEREAARDREAPAGQPPCGGEPSLPIDPQPFGVGVPALAGRGPRPGKRLVSPSSQQAASSNRKLAPEQKLLILDTWQRSGLPAGDFGALIGVNRITLYAWKKKFEEQGPGGLMDSPRKGSGGSKLPDLTRRTILMLKQAHGEWGCQRISDALFRGPGLPAGANAVARVLKEAGYVLEESGSSPHPDKVRWFERAKPNQLWQTDLFTFILKRQNRRVYLVAFMDDHSRYIVGYGLHASQSAALVIEVFRAAIASCGVPQEVLSDNGAQYVTWRGTSLFARELRKHGINHIVATPRHPQTLGKIERFWGTMWRECLDAAVFLDLADAGKRIGHFIDYYNLLRPHQGLDGLTPADRFFGAAPQMLATLKARMNANALELARSGLPKAPFYLSGQVGGRPFSVHAEGERVFLVAEDGGRKEIDLTPPAGPVESMPQPVCAQGIVSSELADALAHEPEPPPGVSPLDGGLRRLADGLAQQPPATDTPAAEGGVP